MALLAAAPNAMLCLGCAYIAHPQQQQQQQQQQHKPTERRFVQK